MLILERHGTISAVLDIAICQIVLPTESSDSSVAKKNKGINILPLYFHTYGIEAYHMEYD